MNQDPQLQQQQHVNAMSPAWDDQLYQQDSVELERQQLIQPTESREKPRRLDINKPDFVCDRPSFLTYSSVS